MLYLKQVNIHSEKFPVRDYYPFNLEILQNTDHIRFEPPLPFSAGKMAPANPLFLKPLPSGAEYTSGRMIPAYGMIPIRTRKIFIEPFPCNGRTALCRVHFSDLRFFHILQKILKNGRSMMPRCSIISVENLW